MDRNAKLIVPYLGVPVSQLVGEGEPLPQKKKTGPTLGERLAQQKTAEPSERFIRGGLQCTSTYRPHRLQLSKFKLCFCI